MCPFKLLYGKATYEWHTGDMRVHTSDIRMTYKYIRVTYGWHTSTYEWHTDDIRVHTSDIRMTHKYIRVTYEWHTSTYDWHANDIRNIKLYNDLELSDRYFQNYLCWKHCFMLMQKIFVHKVVSILILFIRIF